MENEDFQLSIKEAASIIGVSASTIRNWEKNGLIFPKRNASKYRIYDLSDLEVLKKIKFLSIDSHMSIELIKGIIGANVQTESHKKLEEKKEVDRKEDEEPKLNKWKVYRENNNYTLDDVSKGTGISISYLSKIENYDTNISLEMLNKLSEFYGEGTMQFFKERTKEEYVVKKKERKKLKIGNINIKIEELISNSDSILNSYMVTLQGSKGVYQPHKHKGEEFIHIIKGELKVILNNNKEYVIKKGDSMFFKSSEAHNWQNNVDSETVLIWTYIPIQID
ncbi:MAG: helix-turn-helix domain-containing protein [Clostridioides sp.]|jgi:DNA-binding transcriptional MerR regulator|nr:helix-turn-helix domain-containing protein [Clostridioides sp.]